MDYTCKAIVGPTGIGKTYTLMKFLDNPLLVRNLQDLKDFNPKKHTDIVFDDISFKYISKPESVIHILDNDFPSTIRILYGTVTIPPTDKWFTHNDPDFIFPLLASPEQREAIRRRIQIIECHDRRDVWRSMGGELE